jgi:hypothetical protein
MTRLSRRRCGNLLRPLQRPLPRTDIYSPTFSLRIHVRPTMLRSATLKIIRINLRRLILMHWLTTRTRWGQYMEWRNSY